MRTASMVTAILNGFGPYALVRFITLESDFWNLALQQLFDIAQ